MRVPLAALLLVLYAVPATAASSSHIRALDRMMVGLAPESARASATIRRAYRDHLDLLFLDEIRNVLRDMRAPLVFRRPTARPSSRPRRRWL